MPTIVVMTSKQRHRGRGSAIQGRRLCISLPQTIALEPERRTPNAKRRTPNAERRTPNAERRTPNAKRQTPNAKRQTP